MGSNFKGVIFDLFGTIIPRPDRRVHSEMMKEMGALVGKSEKDFREIWLSLTYEKSTWNSGDTVDLMDHVQKTLGSIPDRSISKKMAWIWDDMTRAHFEYFPDVVPAFRTLRQNRFKVGLLTNCGPNVPSIVKGSDIGPLLDGAAFSTEIGLMKPDPISYKIACESIGVLQEETIFIGDGDSNELAGARDATLKAVKIERGKIAGDYRLMEEVEWDPMITDLNDILDLVQSL